MSQFKLINSDDPVPGNGTLPSEFVLKTKAETDIWAKPPSTTPFSAPVLYQTVALDSFKRARVSFNAEWTLNYDQGGLIFVLQYVDGSKKFIKTGIEHTHGKPHLSVVVKDRWADWSLLPVPSGGSEATLEISREPDDSLWIYVVEGNHRSPIREVTWIFSEEGVQETWVGVYAARPSTGGELAVTFGHLIIDLQ
ncbi:hypothetical protein N7468_010534 [Penicillium chermesinum]|uniref:Uncharacterized protein n=1 Tax=Penicillium chermesinum TaxID=63820 RepID=A0A9W9N7U8_9EURO|nr:uncharacterized protein N7468_010534 [Penicillium chermesinum]KAJ5214855.1 hypothetical protein N7468_010534 [Penicillium chermesinum]KAJ6141642.1 hypothetical protein N7470_010032 [Penicillium chermesinum]